MKRILFIMVLLMGTIATFAQEEKTDIVDQLLHEQAVKALEDKKFVIKFNAKHYDRNNRVKYYDDRYCFLEIDGETASYQMYDGRADDEPETGLTHAPVMYQGTASDFSIKQEPNGNIHFTALLQIPYKYLDFWWTIVLKKGSNECIVSKYKKGHKSQGGGRVARLFPIGSTTIMKGEVRR